MRLHGQLTKMSEFCNGLAPNLLRLDMFDVALSIGRRNQGMSQKTFDANQRLAINSVHTIELDAAVWGSAQPPARPALAVLRL